jgi:hypothetical protein
MKIIGLGLAAMGIALAGVETASAANFESVVLVGTPASPVALFRINVATGQVATVWGGGGQFASLPDSSALPPGDYHLQEASWVAVDGKVSWAVYRVDGKSGRSWALSGGGAQPFVWNEVAPPK